MQKPIFMTAIVALVLTSASAATADTYFGFGRTLDEGNTLDLGLITADNGGVVEVYDFHTGTVGDLLGAEELHAGANPDVRVSTRLPVRHDVIAMVRIDGQVVAEKEFNVE